jgi:hypothetical protein
MVKQIGLTILIISIVCFCLLVSYEISRRIAEAYFRKRARDYLEKGQPIRSLQYSVKSEMMWAFNSNNGSSRSMIKDLDRLRTIVEQQREAMCALDVASSIGQIEQTIESLKLFLGNRGNFGLDGRSVRGKAAHEWVSLANTLKRDRLTLRASCNEILKSQVKSLC